MPTSTPTDRDVLARSAADDGTRRARPTRERSARRAVVEWLVIIVGVVVVMLVLQATAVQAFWIPSTSMENTLHKDDRVVVDKLSYLFHSVHRGDVVVFTKPKAMAFSTDKVLIKRVIGLPGDRLVIANGHVYVDDHELTEPYVESDRPTLQGNLKCLPASPCVVPAKDVFVMGDNRTDSYDSRYFGPIPKSSIIGRAILRIWPLNRLGSL
jgi:signal peptidase I